MKINKFNIGMVFILWFVINPNISHANNHSDYTSLKSCQLADIDENNTQTFDCPSVLKDYDLKLLSNDLRTSLMVNSKNKELLYAPAMPHYIGDNIEWRYHLINGKKHYHALIYRLYFNDDMDDDYQSRLIVIRLNGNVSCYLGVIDSSKAMNKKARILADNHQANCVDLAN